MARKNPKSLILRALREASQSEDAAVEFLERNRWGDSPTCPRCQSADVYRMQPRHAHPGVRDPNFRWRCRGCKRMYTVRTGLVIEESRLPLRIWVYAFWKACASKKGISALQISRECEISYKSALFLMHRIRFAMQEDYEAGPKLSGVVEVDETFVGGKPRFPVHRRDPKTGEERKGYQYIKEMETAKPKAPVMALVERGGRVRLRHIERVDGATLGDAVRELVERGSTVYTDENPSYIQLGKDYYHDAVKHTAKEYARGDISTNTVEGVFSLLKRGVYGTFHSVSKHHLHRYLSEFEFRYNNRNIDDGERTVAAIRGAEGKRLLYRGPEATA